MLTVDADVMATGGDVIWLLILMLMCLGTGFGCGDMDGECIARKHTGYA